MKVTFRKTGRPSKEDLKIREFLQWMLDEQFEKEYWHKWNPDDILLVTEKGFKAIPKEEFYKQQDN